MIRALAFAALIAAAPALTPAAAAPPSLPTLKRAVSVSTDIVRIGDLIDNAGAAADTPIFRSPDVGTTGSVPLQQVLDAIRPYHLSLIDTGTLSEVEVTRTGRTIDAADIEARIARTFAGRYGLGEANSLTVTLDGMVRPITVDQSATVDLVLMSAAFDGRSGRFDITFDIPGNPYMRRLRLTGTVVETVAAAVLTHALARGELVKDSDVTIERRPKAVVGAEGIASAGEAIGLAARQAMRAGQPLRRTDLMKPEVIHRDDNVTLVYEVPGILLTTRGKSLESGAEGDVINVLNIQSKRTIQGVVSGPNRVTIMAATPRVSSEAAVAAVPQSVASR
jgi:flagellar basal body P-ring formation protein FlgA